MQALEVKAQELAHRNEQLEKCVRFLSAKVAKLSKLQRENLALKNLKRYVLQNWN